MDYAYTGFERVSLSGYFQKEMAQSSDETASSTPIDCATDTFFGSVAYAQGAWNMD